MIHTIKHLLIISTLVFVAHSPAHAIKLKIATLSPDGSVWLKKLKQGAEEIKKKTDGRVKFRFYPGGVMGGDKTVLRKIKIGQLHGAIFSNGTLNNIYSGSQVYNLVMKFNSYDEIDHVRPVIDPLLFKGLEKNGFTTLGLSEIGFAYLMSTAPIKNVRDLQQQKAWVPENNTTAAEAMNAFSVTPIPLPLQDVLIALQTGMVDVVAGSPVGAITLQWHTKIRYITDLPLAYMFGGFVIGNRAMKKIKPADQVIVKDVMRRMTSELDQLARKDNDAALAAIQNNGVKLIKPDNGTVTNLKKLIQSANKNLITSTDMDKEVIEALNKALSKFRNSQSQANIN